MGAFYDSVILYATALQETIEANGSEADGRNVTLRMWNRTIEGITGNLSIDENGDRNADYSLLDMNPDTGIFEARQLQCKIQYMFEARQLLYEYTSSVQYMWSHAH